jgi:hypothetical protein
MVVFLTLHPLKCSPNSISVDYFSQLRDHTSTALCRGRGAGNSQGFDDLRHRFLNGWPVRAFAYEQEHNVDSSIDERENSFPPEFNRLLTSSQIDSYAGVIVRKMYLLPFQYFEVLELLTESLEIAFNE